jgi:hypothetical protein
VGQYRVHLLVLLMFEPSENFLSEDGYPSDEELESIRNWPIHTGRDLTAVLSYIGARWNWGDSMWVKLGRRRREWPGGPLHRRYEIHTGGWSGNEDLIYALRENTVAWMMTWKQTSVGGHYVLMVNEDMK